MIWLDAQLPPALAGWIEEELGIPARALRDLGLRDAADREIFQKAQETQSIIVTKDRDFADLHFRHGAPPKIIVLKCGNLTNRHLRAFLANKLAKAMKILETEDIVEMG